MSTTNETTSIELKVAFSYEQTEVMMTGDRHVNLTDMWRAAGSPENKGPHEWRRKEGRGFVADLATSLNTPTSRIIRGTRGKGGATWAHWQVALAYAAYLSPAFHRHVNECFRQWVEEANNPELKAERAIAAYRRQGRSDAWIRARLEGKLRRVGLTHTLKERGVEREGYALATNAIYTKLLGGSAREIRLERGLRSAANLREHVDAAELGALDFAEAMAQQLVQRDRAWGTRQCADACARAGEAARLALDFLGLSGLVEARISA